MIKRYALRTKSGSLYYIEDHTHLFSHPTWFIFAEERQFHLIGIFKTTNDIIHAEDITSIDEFVGRKLLYNKVMLNDKDLRLGPAWNSCHTSTEIIEVLRFK